VRLAARTSAVSTGSPWLDRLLAGPGFLNAGTLVIDSRWITRRRIPALDRRIEMTCSLSLEPDM
jgi:hypothetical protein